MKITTLNHLLEKKYNFNNTNYEEYIGDFFSISDLENIFTNIDIVIHLISTSIPQYSDNYKEDLKMNVYSTLQMLDVARKKGVKKIIFASSGGTIYGNTHNLPICEDASTNPLCSYGITKLMIEKYLDLYEKQYNLKYISLRIANPYGSYFNIQKQQGLINIYINKILRNDPLLIYGDGTITRDYIYVDDVAKAFLKAVKADTKKHIFNIGTGRGATILNIIDILECVSQRKFKVIYDRGRNFDVKNNVLDINKALKELNWCPSTTLEDGIKKTFVYYKNLN